MYIPIPNAEPGIPDNPNTTMYTQRADVTAGAFQNNREITPIPT